MSRRPTRRPRSGGHHRHVDGHRSRHGRCYLAEHGFRVFAGVRGEVDGEALTSRDHRRPHAAADRHHRRRAIAHAVESVTAAVGERGLAGLVNNAGIVKPGPLEFQPLDDFREQLEVNLVGQLAVIQAFLPLIRRGNGRIVNVGSIGGRLVLPIHGAYHASKFGMEALSDALRLELRQWRIPVSLVDPGATQTAIFGKTLAALDAMQQTLQTTGVTSVRRADGRDPADRREDGRRRSPCRGAAEGDRRGPDGRRSRRPATWQARAPRQRPLWRGRRRTASRTWRSPRMSGCRIPSSDRPHRHRPSPRESRSSARKAATASSTSR